MTENYNKSIPFENIPIDSEVTLRQLRLDEAETIFQVVDENRDYLSEWLPWVNHTLNIGDSEKFIADTLHKRTEGSEYGYAIVVNGRPSGHMSLMHLTDGEPPEIGYWIDKSVSGRGIVTKAANALTEFGFKEFGLERIIIKAEPNNFASNKVAEKIGYTLETTNFDESAGNEFNIWIKVPNTEV